LAIYAIDKLDCRTVVNINKNYGYGMHIKLIFSVVAASFSMTSLAAHNETIELEAVEIRAPMIDSRISKHPATVETFDKKQIEENINAATPAQTLNICLAFKYENVLLVTETALLLRVRLVLYPVRKACFMQMEYYSLTYSVTRSHSRHVGAW
jgi:hypothetical protein